MYINKLPTDFKQLATNIHASDRMQVHYEKNEIFFLMKINRISDKLKQKKIQKQLAEL
jgi:hypothetical protein